jgi:hypothetical protein
MGLLYVKRDDAQNLLLILAEEPLGQHLTGRKPRSVPIKYGNGELRSVP